VVSVGMLSSPEPPRGAAALEATAAAIGASLNGVPADDVRSLGSGNRPTRPLGSNSDKKTRSRRSQRADGEQCASGLVKVRHGLMTPNPRSPH
jgi:hypothetical protein